MIFLRILFILLDTAILLAIPGACLFIGASGFSVVAVTVAVPLLFVPFTALNVFPGIYRLRSLRPTVLAGGADLLTAFLLGFYAETAFGIYRAAAGLFRPEADVPYIILALITCFIYLWNGVIRVIVTSTRLGVVLKVLAAVFCMIPVVHIPFLLVLIISANGECAYEARYIAHEKELAASRVCATKYPILLVHGVFFRDSSVLNYWGRVPAALTRCGAVIRYGNQQSALSVRESAAELAERIEDVVKELGCEKVNIIAHSKGGLDARYAVSRLGSDKYVASLTTINTPHRGCIFVESIYNKFSAEARERMAKMYNAAARRVGDTEPDFLAAVADLRESACSALNAETPDSPDVYYQSIGTSAKYAYNGRFPLNVSLPFVRRTDGENDGLVSLASMAWGADFRVFRVNGRRGITHADMIDLNRENIPDFNVRSFYIDLVSDLRLKGF
ncbi:MAG: alpha/beta fold hydrolase [Ruminiclostridium sp.]|nr:alpha/beta fold hydrolase [Ruminiclostridium sp.]